jgi:hypothetical protein
VDSSPNANGRSEESLEMENRKQFPNPPQISACKKQVAELDQKNPNTRNRAMGNINTLRLFSLKQTFLQIS